MHKNGLNSESGEKGHRRAYEGGRGALGPFEKRFKAGRMAFEALEERLVRFRFLWGG